MSASTPPSATGATAPVSERWAPLGAALAVLTVGALTWHYLVDDAFIVARYAAHLASGDGWSMNPGVTSDGITAPLWLLPIAALETLGLDASIAQRVLGLAATAAAVLLTVRDQTKRRGLVAVLCAAQGTLGIWGGAGLETGLATLALVLVARPVWGAPGWRLAALGALVIPWLRPELLPVAGVLAFGGPRPRAVVAALLLGLVGVLGFRLALFGHPLPLASAAKLGGLADGLHYGAIGLLLTTGAGGVALAGAATRTDRLLVVALLMHWVSLVIAGGDWMPGHRLFVPALPLYAVAMARGFGALGRRLRWVALALAVLVPLAMSGLQTRLAWEAGAQRRNRGPSVAAAVEGRDPVALVDVGYIGWRTGVEVIDLGGITDPVIARAPGGHLDKHVPLGHLVAREPRTILLHSATRPEVDDDGRLVRLAGYPVERRVAGLPWVRAHFRVGAVIEYGPAYWYVRLDRGGY